MTRQARWTPDTLDYTIYHDRQSGAWSDSLGVSWNLKQQ